MKYQLEAMYHEVKCVAISSDEHSDARVTRRSSNQVDRLTYSELIS